jgi:hypothetical protein
MTISTARGGGFRPTFKQLGVVFALASLVAGTAMSPASADGRHGHEGRGGGYGGGRGDGYGRGYSRDNWHSGYGRSDWRGGAYYEPYAVYAPPPVYYPPQPSPGVSLFFPIQIR